MVKIKCPYFNSPTGCPFSGNYVCGPEPCVIEGRDEEVELSKKIYGMDYIAQ